MKDITRTFDTKCLLLKSKGGKVLKLMYFSSPYLSTKSKSLCFRHHAAAATENRPFGRKKMYLYLLGNQ